MKNNNFTYSSRNSICFYSFIYVAFLLVLGGSTLVETVTGFYIGMSRNFALFGLGLLTAGYLYLSRGRRMAYKSFRNRKKKEFYLIYLFFAVCLFYAFYSWIVKSRDLLDVIKTSWYYFLIIFVPFFSFAFSFLLKYRRRHLIRRTLIISTAFDVIAIFIWLLIILFGNRFGFIIHTRSLFPRFILDSGLLMISPAVSYYAIKTRMYKKLAVFNLITFFFNLIFINQTRGYLLIYFLIFASIFLLKIVRRKSIFLTSKIIFVLFVAFLLFFAYSTYSGLLSKLNISFGDTLDYRVITIKGYFSRFIKNPLFGFGFLPDKMDTADYELMYGYSGFWSHDDVGLIGILDIFGLLGLTCIISIIALPFKICKKMSNNELIFSCLIVCFGMLYGCISLIIFNSTRYITLVLILSLFSAIKAREPSLNISICFGENKQYETFNKKKNQKVVSSI